MNKGKTLVAIASLLIVINIAFLAFHFFKPKHHKHEGPKQIIIEKLHFDKEQIKDYELLITEHRTAVQNIEKQIGETKDVLYKSILNTQLSRDSILNEIGKNQIALEQIHLAHFEQIKALCTESQLADYKLLLEEIGQLFKGKKKRK